APQAKTYADFRKLLDDKEVDAVIVATPDHWHAQITILACEAGKDVYVEKPVMYRLAEGKAMREAVRRTRRIVQAGTQHRSADHMAEAAKMVQGGQIGEVRFVRVWNFMPYTGVAPLPDSEPPADLNWDAWVGPSPKVPFNRSRLYFGCLLANPTGFTRTSGTIPFDRFIRLLGVKPPLKVPSWESRLT